MKQLIVFALLVLSTEMFAQKVLSTSYDVYTPRTLYAGTLMSARTGASGYDDTTQAFVVRGLAAVYVGIETAVNDSARILVSYQPSKNGVTWDALVLYDSLSTTGTVGKIKYIQLPANAMGAYAVRVRVYSNTDLLRYSDSPSTTITTRIIRVPYTKQ